MRRRKRMMEDLDRDIRDHIERETEDNIARGMTPGEARHAAFRKFGNVTRMKEETREVWSFVWLEQLLQDIRFGFRMLRKSPGFTAVAILTLAIGIGANTAIFSVVHAVLLKGLPYPASDRLALIWSRWGNEMHGPATGLEVWELRQRARVLDQVAGIWVTTATIEGNADPEQVRAAQTTANFLPLLSERPALGRFFTSDDEKDSAPGVVILSDGLWRRQFGADPSVIGRSLRVFNFNTTVVGVMPPGFRLIFPDDVHVPTDVEMFGPLGGNLRQMTKNGFIRVLVRLNKDATLAQAQSEADSIATQLRAGNSDFAKRNLHLTLVALHAEDVRGTRPAILALFGGVGLVLLIACANVANLLLARASQRRRETAVRGALGAAGMRIVRQMLTESVVLGTIGGIVGIGVGWAALKVLLSLRPPSLEKMGAFGLDAGVLAFTLAISVFTGILFGLAPALESTRVSVMETLREGGRIERTGRRGARQTLIACEVALGLLLLLGSGLMVRTFTEILRVQPGFQPEKVLTFQVSLPGPLFREQRANQFVQDLEKNLMALPGVRAAAAVSHLPLDEGLGNWYGYYWRESAPPREQNTVMADQRSIGVGYFATIGATFISGRDFTEFDDAAHTHVAIVDDELAAATWPNENPLGKRLVLEDSPKGPFQFENDTLEVVGVVRHIQYHSLTRNIRPQVYVPFPLAPRPSMAFVVRAEGALGALAGAVRQEVHKMDRQMPVSHVLPLQDYVNAARASTRFVTLLASLLGAFALVLAVVGIYGVTSYTVGQRTGELGIRMALGARSRDLERMVLTQGMIPVAIGAGAGLAMSFVLTPLLAGLLFGVRPNDAWTILAALVVLGASGVAACYVPARRATRIDPAVALRHE